MFKFLIGAISGGSVITEATLTSFFFICFYFFPEIQESLNLISLYNCVSAWLNPPELELSEYHGLTSSHQIYPSHSTRI